MSVAFTNPTTPSGTTFRTLLNEITLAYTEHKEHVVSTWNAGTHYAGNGSRVFYNNKKWKSAYQSPKILWSPSHGHYVLSYNTGQTPGANEFNWWIEQTYFDLFPWKVDITYVAGNQVFYSGEYWQSLQAANTGNTPADGSEWWKLSVSTVDIQVSSFIGGIQSWLETNCVSFLDHSAGPLDDARTGFRLFTLATWRAVAGITGFRRASDWDGENDPTWLAEGTAQKGDILGPWIFEDLQKAFSALRWTLYDSTAYTGYGMSGEGGDPPYPYEYDGSMAAARGAAEGSYTASGGTGGFAKCSATGLYVIYVEDPPIPRSVFSAGLETNWGSVTMPKASTFSGNSRSADLYFLTIAFSFGGGSEDLTFNLFNDFTATKDELSVVESFGDTMDELSASFGDDTKAPWGPSPGVDRLAVDGYRVTRMSFVVKWNFTNQNA
jgi:hypothetical protein